MSNEPVEPVQQANAAAPTAAAAAKTGPTAPAAPGFNNQTTIGSVGELREKAPEVYNAMLQGMATTICNHMKSSQDRIKKIMRDAERDAEGHG